MKSKWQTCKILFGTPIKYGIGALKIKKKALFDNISSKRTLNVTNKNTFVEIPAQCNATEVKDIPKHSEDIQRSLNKPKTQWQCLPIKVTVLWTFQAQLTDKLIEMRRRNA